MPPTASSAPLLTLSGLACQRDGRVLFAGMDLTLGSGDYVELTGPNGSGKSTLLRCVAGLFADYEGHVAAAPFRYLGHKPGVSLLLTPLEQLEWFMSMTETSGEPDAALGRVGLAGYGHVRCQQLSAGQQRRVALARLVLCSHRLWLLDEPLTALDEQGQQLVRELIAEQRAGGGAVLCATHQRLELAGAVSIDLGARPVAA